ncbi:uncharacterized protein LOC118434350 [Folsomia candida]|uniref:uncharacterized protein LOC118434350 n=1 Tax=Folsomia candida TaxID=158441 RepID=UPI0016053F09|nr:uncharacterized protein LOC118434350 [Folsomia candida]
MLLPSICQLLNLIRVPGVYSQESCEVGVSWDGAGIFNRLSAISKYVEYSSSVSQAVSYLEAVSICQENGLDIAEVNSMVDFMSLKSFIQEGQSYWIGMNDLDQDGIWKDSNGRISKFQVFGIGDPDDELSDCVLLRRAHGELRMFDEMCNVGANFLCQYPEGSYCDIQSFQHSAEHVIGGREDLIPLGESPNLFVSTVQKPFQHAILSCIQAKKVPLYFNDSDTTKDVTENIKSHLLSFDLDEETQFWTSGKLERDATGGFNGIVYWDVLETSYDLYHNPLKIPYDWAPTEPNDRGGGYEMGCVDISYPSEGSTPVLQASNCEIPKFYICMDSKLVISKLDFQARLKRIANEDEGLRKSLVVNNLPLTNHSGSSKKSCPPEPIKNIDPIKLNHSALLELPQTLDLMMFILKNNIKNGRTKIKVKHSIVWKRDFIDTIFEIFKTAVDHHFVPHEMLHIAREINILYQNSYDGPDNSNHTKNWEIILGVLDGCLESLEPYNFATIGFRLKYLMTVDHKFEISIPPEEAAEHLDLSIDILWHVFSFTLGSCYPTAASMDQDPLVWAAEYYNLFLTEILFKVKDIWFDETNNNLLRAGLIYGDLDLRLAINNFRAAAISSYILNDIEDRQVVRPL